MSLSVLLDNIRSAWNVGSILRSAEGFGFKHAYLCGITPTPKEEPVQKTALGAEEFVTWSYHKDSVRQVIELKEEGWYVWCLEDSENSVPLQMNDHKKKRNGIPGEKIVLILGNEVTGVDPGLMELSDRIYSIPMRGRKRSFNVAVAFGIAAFTMQSE